jgi:hypothetical protein
MRLPRALAGWALAWASMFCAAAASPLAQTPTMEEGAPPRLPQVFTPNEPPPPGMPQPVPGMPQPGTPGAGSGQAWLPRNMAELQALDRIDNRGATLNVPVGQTVQFEHISITVRACVERPPDQAPDAAAFLQIVDSRPGAPGFTGWMLVAEPFVSMLQHPVFDVRVVACH